MKSEEACISFIEHPSFSKEIFKFNKKYDGGGIGFKSLKKLLEQQLNIINRQIILSSTVLRRVDHLGANLEVYKITMRVKGLSSGQSPRVCFRYVGNLIVFLCFGTHLDNYKDSELKDAIKKRIKDLDSDVQFG